MLVFALNMNLSKLRTHSKKSMVRNLFEISLTLLPLQMHKNRCVITFSEKIKSYVDALLFCMK